MMSVQTLLGDLNLDIREPAVCVTLISKWVTITGTMLKKSAMVLVDQKGTTIEGTLYEELEASNQITMDEAIRAIYCFVFRLYIFLSTYRFDEIKCRFKHMRNIEGFSKILIEPEITEIQAFRMRY
ncbi:unnamed protein product [Brassica napus]|uniref:(rape) hypothetical protein n=1 Tax=Brassica napus TaxID=3708 RepID=A0A816TK99_BRANA|nr:unnamed protein product [Brassica napus]